MRKSIYAAIIAMLFLHFPGAAFAEFDPFGRWRFEGGGYAEKGFVRARLNAEGVLDVETTLIGGDIHVTGYRVKANLDVTRFDINVWKDSGGGDLPFPVKAPYLNPTMNEPFKLPPITYDGLTYEVEFTSVNSGTLKIYGVLDVDVVGDVTGDSASTLWREGTKKPDIPDMTSGCNAGLGAMALLLVALVLARAFKK